MPSVTFAEELVTTIPPSLSTTEKDVVDGNQQLNNTASSSTMESNSSRSRHHHDNGRRRRRRRQPQEEHKRPSIWRLVIVGILVSGAVIVGAIIWRKTRKDKDSSDDDNSNDSSSPSDGTSPSYDDGRFQNPDQVGWKILGNDIRVQNQSTTKTDEGGTTTPPIHVALSADARTLVAANDTCIQIWKWNAGDAWELVAKFPDTVVYALTLAGDGHRLAVVSSANKIRFYDNIKAGRWSLRPEFLGALPQASLTLDYDGIVFAKGFNTTFLTLSEWNFADATWMPQTIHDDATQYLQGTVVQQLCLSADGKSLVMAVQDSDGITIVRTYTRTLRSDGAGSFQWIPKGQALTSGPLGNSNEFFGHALAISSTGNVLAITSPESQQRRGRVQVFEYRGNKWHVRKQAIVGQEDTASITNINHDGLVTASFGRQVCLSSNANVLSILDGSTVRLYQVDASTAQGWTAVGRQNCTPFATAEPRADNDNNGTVHTTRPDSTTTTTQPIVWDILRCSADGRTLVVASRTQQLIRAAQVVVVQKDDGG